MTVDKFPSTKIPQSHLQILIQQFDGTMRHARETTRHVYKKGLDQLVSFAKANTFSFTPDNFGEFRLWLFNRKKLSKNTVNVYLTACRRFCEFLVELGVLTKNPAWSVHGTAQEFKILKLRLTEVASAISRIDRTTVLGKRDFAFLCAIFESGAAISELINADIGDLNRDGKQAKLHVKPRGARSKFEMLTLSESASTAIYDYIDSRGVVTADQPLFGSGRGRKDSKVRLSLRGARFAMQRRLDFGNQKTIRLDSLRTYCVVRLMSKGRSSDEIRSIMRFKSDMPFRKIIFNTISVAETR